MKPNLYFFEDENPHQVIQRPLHLRNQKNQTIKARRTRNINASKSNYGVYWYISPKKWDKMDKKYKKDQQNNKEHNNQTTNSILIKLVKKHKSEKAKKLSKTPSKDLKHLQKQENEIKAFEKDLMSVIKPPPPSQFTNISLTMGAISKNIVRRKSKLYSSGLIYDQ